MRKSVVSVIVGVLLTGLCAAHAASGHAASGGPQAATDLLKEKMDAVLAVLEKDGIAEADQKKQIMEIVAPVIDFELMAKLTLGRANWNRLSGSEQKEFVELFVDRLKASYLDKTTLYSDQELVFKEGREQGGKIHVPMEIIGRDEKADVLYKFYSSPKGLKVYDVEVNGVSLIKSYRSQFDEILRNGTVQDLFGELRESGQ